VRILHLGYEDQAQPGSGGGSVRTREINRRLATRHEVTVLVAGYRGASPRIEDGVRWAPLWPRRDGKLNRLAYFALLGPAILRCPHDLLVEDFSAPFGVGFAPLFTRRPVVASVQWLFAAQMRQKYGLPFDTVERLGLPLYDDFVVVSDWLGSVVRERRPGACITTIPNGIEPGAFMANKGAGPRHLLFVGRLDREQKGTDLLLEVAACLHESLGARMPRLLIVGDGPDQAALVDQATQLGLSEKVQFLGRVEGGAKFDLMAGAHAVLMPSRFETFGMVAVEALATGTPVVAFDVGPLKEVAGGGGARLVAPFDVGAFAREAAALVQDTARRDELGRQGQQWARRYDWDLIATQQEAVYLRAVEEQAGRSAMRARLGADRDDLSAPRTRE
jgi:glycosyltransferase involved in cell wall biosynthesis